MSFEFALHLLADLRRLAEAAEGSQRPNLEAKYGEPGIVAETIAQQPFSAGVAVSLGQLQTFQRFTVLSRLELHRAKQAVADQSVGRVVLPVGDFHDLARQRERGPHLRRDVVGHPKAIKHGEALQIGADAGVEKPLRLDQGRDRFRRSVALPRH